MEGHVRHLDRKSDVLYAHRSGVCVLDYDNDGWQDILFVNSMDWPEHKTSKSYPALYHNNGDGTFTDVTRQAGLEVEMYGLGCAAADYTRFA